MDTNELVEKIQEITDNINDETIKGATDQQLMEYLFLIEKLKRKIVKSVKLEEGK